MSEGTIIAFGAGEAIISDRDNPIHEYILESTGKENPRIGFLGTASGDHPRIEEGFYRSYANRSRASDLKLFYRELTELRPWFEAQDAFLVGGGNTANMLAIWRIHGVDVLLEEAHRQGKTLAGGSAGALCWFEGGITDSFSNRELHPLKDGLNLLEGSICPHYNSPSGLRKPAYEEAILHGNLQPGFAVDDYAAVVFRQDERAVQAVSLRPDNGVKAIGKYGNKISENVIEAEPLYNK